MLYELRSYLATPGRLDELLENAADYAIPLQREHGFEHVGFWTVSGEDSSRDADLFYILRWESRIDRDTKWQSFLSDSRWVARQSKTEAEVPLLASHTTRFLEPTEFSALQ